MQAGGKITSELVFVEPSRTARSSRVSVAVTSDTLAASEVYTRVLSVMGEFIFANHTNQLQYSARPSPARKGTAAGFSGSLHKLVPALKQLSDSELERLIESAETDAPDSE